MSEAAPNPETRIALFQRKEVRRAIHDNEWWFVITDVVAVLTDSPNPGDYLKKLRKRDPSLAEAFKGGGQLVPPLVCTLISSLSCANSSNTVPVNIGDRISMRIDAAVGGGASFSNNGACYFQLEF